MLNSNESQSLTSAIDGHLAFARKELRAKVPISDAFGRLYKSVHDSINAVTSTDQPQPQPSPQPSPTTPPTTTTPKGGFYVDKDSTAYQAYLRAFNENRKSDADALFRLANTPQAIWYNGGSTDFMVRHADDALAHEQELVAVLYNVPGRDEGNHSAGGAGSVNAYKATVDAFVEAIRRVRSTVIIEPDAVVLPDYLDAIRIECLNYAMDAISKAPNVVGYIDAGHSNWRSVADMVARLKQLRVPSDIGLVGNVSNYQPTTNTAKYLSEIAAGLGGGNFVIDTSRNGTETIEPGWCNIPGKLTGRVMTHDTGIANCDLLGWIKRPGESDGWCEGGPGAGQFFDAYAIDLAKRSIATGKL